jgi:SAM-dependent methyltransferase
VNPSERQAIQHRVAAYYTSKLVEFGTTSRGVDWNGETSHAKRHSQFLRLLEETDGSVIDLGCGFGHFFEYLRSAGHAGPFIGLDVSAEMIAAAERLHGSGPDRTWVVGDLAGHTADYAVASGLFNVKGDVPHDTWEDYVLDVVHDLAKASRKGFGFNVLSLSSDPDRRRPDLFYADPARFIDLCIQRYGRSVALLQDYGLYEFTLLVRHPAPAQT